MSKAIERRLSGDGIHWETIVVDENDGGTAPITRAQYDVALTDVVGGVATKLPLTLNYGDALLDLTDPLNPTPVTSGTYAFAATVGIGDMSDTTVQWNLQLTVDGDDFAAAMIAAASSGTGGIGTTRLALTLPFYVPAGSPCFLTVQHTDTTPNVDFNGHVFVQRLS